MWDTNVQPFTHKTSTRSRGIKLTVTKQGEVVVTTPPLVPTFLVKQFVRSHTDWIAQRLAARTAAHAPDTVLVFGKEYQKKIGNYPEKPLGVFVTETDIVVNTPELRASDAEWTESENKQLTRFLKQAARTYIFSRTPILAQKMAISYGTITLREQDTRWGSCSSAGNLNFNWRLVHTAPCYIDYVIIHELAHRVHMNHSAAFWNLVEQYDPDYRMHKLWLKQQGGGVY